MIFFFIQCRKTAANPSDRIDNDCDGIIDEEIVDGKDNDGDGFVDEDYIQVVQWTFIINSTVTVSGPQY